tara:strand:- start:311 stop:502 length:192 start_codon:yes stop_codon:yes gene_type:complete
MPEIYDIEELAESIKFNLHKHHMMYIDGEDQVTHRWCRRIIYVTIADHIKRKGEQCQIGATTN